ncbi:SCAN domain-containing protein 3-like [Maniola hyperantus]|uniref:SCAN domain-containing protein 3-like n=1 Tax=Aphantopus hyperantus TaxID=2795564 RepID=UPI00374A5058
MVGFAADGTNSMFGQHHSLSTLFAKDIPNLFLMKCICHSFHLCASYACKKLPRGVEDFARDVYNYIQNSPKRIGDYKEFQYFVNVKPYKLLHPAQTRWLSLLQVVKRLLEQLPALKLYFQSAVLTDRLLAAQSILDKCLEPTTELYLEFLNFVLPYFNNLNKEMQCESPKLYLLYEKVFTTYKTILECFVKPQYLELTEQEKISCHDKALALETKILNIDFAKTENHLSLEDLYLGGLCPTDLTELDREWRTLRNTNIPFQEEQLIKADEFWRHISKIKNSDSSRMFPLVAQFAQNLLTLPHSSANVERLFSAINLMKTNIRNRLSTETLSGLLYTKSFIKKNSEPSQEHLKLFNKYMYKFNLPEAEIDNIE